MVAGQKVKGDIFWLRVDYLIMFWIKAWLFLITLVLSIGLYRGYMIFLHSASSPFDYASTHNYWIPDPADPTGVKHIVPPSFTISDGDPLPIGRTLTLNLHGYLQGSRLRSRPGLADQWRDVRPGFGGWYAGPHIALGHHPW
jgi:hypothetical protein